jgi:hypothetical protein
MPIIDKSLIIYKKIRTKKKLGEGFICLIKLKTIKQMKKLDGI